MRFLFLLILLSTSINSFGQSKKERITFLEQENATLLMIADTLISIQGQMMEESYKMEQSNNYEIAVLKATNTQLKSIIRGYVMELDSLNSVIQSLEQNQKEVKSNPNAPEVIETNNDNPFGSGGQDSGTVTNSDHDGGNSPGFGPDNGGHGNSTAPRYVIQNVHFNMDYDHAVTFAFKVTIDEYGNVIGATLIKGNTTTTDQDLINKMRSYVIEQVKYSKSEGASAVVKMYSIRLEPK